MLSEFNGDVRRMLSFAWGAEASSLYPTSPAWKMSKSDHPDCEVLTEGEPMKEPIPALQGLNGEEIRQQASQIRGRVKRVVDDGTYQLIELKLCCMVDTDTMKRKERALKSVVGALRRTTTWDKGTVTLVCMQFGNMGEVRVQNRLVKTLNEMFLDALDMVERRI